jgi:hypothetical protein
VLGGSLAEAVAAAAELGEVRLHNLSTVRATVPQLPPSLRAPVTTLLDGMATAAAGARGAVALSDAQVTSLQRRTYALLDRAQLVPTGRQAARLQRHGERLEQRITAGVDRPALYSSALALTQAIDTALPALQEAAGTPQTTTVEGCDVLDQAPALCIGNTGANVITKDYALVVDLGGDDRHLNNAGGASPTANGNGIPVAVTIDVAGNDVYSTTAGDQHDASQGVGRTGGLGVLLDAAGNDSYTTVGRRQGETFSDLINAQGAAVAGVGILADLGGADTYRMDNEIGAAAGNGAQGLGTGVLGGMALALDRGTGNDTATLSGTPAAHEADGFLTAGRTRAGGFGNGAGASVAIYADDGGADVLTVRAVPEAVGLGGSGSAAAASVAQGFGYAGLGGTGVSITGSGAQQVRVEGNATAPTPAPISSGVFGWVGLGGLAAAVDTGGDDIYSIDLRSMAVVAPVITDECMCAGREYVAESGVASLSGMGNTALGGVAVLADLGGNDAYSSTSISGAQLAVTDNRSPDQRLDRLQLTALAGQATAWTQGWGVAGVGLLLDAAGNDSYTIDARGVAEVTGSGAAVPNTIIAGPGTAIAEGQGAGWGEFGGVAPGAGMLLDGGGIDRYSSSARLFSTEGGEPVITPGAGLAQASVRMNGVGVLADLDGGAADTFSTVPAIAPCTGARGVGVWRDCGALLGLGVNS